MFRAQLQHGNLQSKPLSSSIDVMVQIYQFLILLCYIDAADVVFAPPEGYSIDEALCAELGRVVSLMNGPIPEFGLRKYSMSLRQKRDDTKKRDEAEMVIHLDHCRRKHWCCGGRLQSKRQTEPLFRMGEQGTSTAPISCPFS